MRSGPCRKALESTDTDPMGDSSYQVVRQHVPGSYATASAQCISVQIADSGTSSLKRNCHFFCCPASVHLGPHVFGEGREALDPPDIVLPVRDADAVPHP